MAVQDADTIDIDDIHRLGATQKGNPRPKIVRFLRRYQRQDVWDARRHLKGTPYSMNEDLPDVYKRARSILVPVMKAARTAGSKATLVLNKVKIDGRLYGIDDICQLPKKFDPAQECMRKNSNTTCFFGRHTPLSNFYPCSFVVQNVKYSSTEQFIQHKKAEYMGNDVLAHKILLTSDPAAMRSMVKSLKGDTQQWYDRVRDEILPAIRAKFHQNPKLLDSLLATGDHTLGEAALDPFWGIGLKLNNPQNLDPNLWTGQNIMGKLLMSIRDELK